MDEIFGKLFEADFMPHGHCYFWRPAILWGHAISDSIIALAYATIPMSLVFIFKKRKDFKYIWMMVFFAVFILGCGATHVMDVITIWLPYYRIDIVIRAITALASIGTAILLIKITPQVLLIPSVSEWKRVNEELKLSHQKLKHSYDDLSEAQALLQQSNSDLEAKVEARTVELERKNQELRRINYDLDSFVYVASHDLKAPIANLQRLISMLDDEVVNREDREVRELIGMIEESIDKFERTIHYLSDINRIQRANNKDVSNVKFENVLEDVRMSVSEVIKMSNIKIVSDFSISEISFSLTDIRSIFYNLITNSIKYRAMNRAAEIKISSSMDKDWIKLEFQDNGIGFDINKKDKAFMMFKRLHDHVEGTGVGLYMVKRIIENACGVLEVDSAIGKGTTFTIKLKPVRENDD